MSTVVSCNLAPPGAITGHARGIVWADCMGFSCKKVKLLRHSVSPKLTLPGASIRSSKEIGNGVSRLHGVLDGFGNQQGNGDVIFIGINYSTIVIVFRSITPNLKTPIR